MGSTLKKYFKMAISEVSVDFLMATFNVEKFLSEFLDSLSTQVGVKINLIVSDDGSNDRTLEIIDYYKFKFGNFELLNGPGLGPAANFFWLMKHANSDFIAFADQDDIWLPDHLLQGIETLKQNSNIPAMTYGRVVEFGSKMNDRIWPLKDEIGNLAEICFENYARGCTIIFNKNLLEAINEYEPKHAIMHDWWLFLYASTYGRAIFIRDVTVRYRVHEGNAVGVRSRTFRHAINSLLIRRWPVYLQISEFVSMEGGSSKNVTNNQVSYFLNILNSSIYTRIRFILLSRIRLRQKMLDEVKIRLGICFLASLLMGDNND